MMAFHGGEPPRTSWFGALAGRELPAGVEFAFDDGELRLFTLEQLAADFKAGTLEALDAAKGGLVDDHANMGAASRFVRVGRKSADVLVGRSDERLVFGLPVFVSFYGMALDEKTPLHRAMTALNTEGTRLMKNLGYTIGGCQPNIGLEQEYFLVS